MLTQYTLKMPHAVYSGKDALDKLTQIIGTGVKKTAVFTGELSEQGFWSCLFQRLKNPAANM